MRPVVWLINGIPGVGKTTTAKSLAMRFEKSAHIEGDSVQEMVKAGLVYPGGEPVDESDRQLTICIENQCILADSFAKNGFIIVIDFVVANMDRYRQYCEKLTEYDLRLVTLAPGKQVALERDKKRDEKTVAHLWLHLDDEMRSALGSTGLWIDNSNLNVDQTVDRILSKI